MKAMFANLTSADFRRPSPKERRAAERRHVHALFDEIQIAIYNGDWTSVDYLMGELAIAGQRRERTTWPSRPTEPNASSKDADLILDEGLSTVC
jgi:hypothetical protein